MSPWGPKSDEDIIYTRMVGQHMQTNQHYIMESHWRFMQHLWHVDMHRRPTAKEAVEMMEEFLTEFQNYVMRLSDEPASLSH